MEIELPKNPSLKGILFDSQIRLKKFLVIFLQILIIFFFFFLVHMRILRERDKENFCFRKQKLKASVKSKIEIKLYYLKIPYLESRIPKIPSREKGRGETEIEGGEKRGEEIFRHLSARSTPQTVSQRRRTRSCFHVRFEKCKLLERFEKG